MSHTVGLTPAMGEAVLVIGILTVLGGGAWLWSNPAAGVVWAISVVMYVVSGLLELGAEYFWLSALLTAMLLAMGIAVRWSQ